MPFALEDYLQLTPGTAEAQWRSIRDRREVAPGQNQVDYVPVETLLCAAAMLVVGDASYGSGMARKGPRPIPELAALFKRRRTSITSKMANLDGGRSRGGKSDERLWEVLSANHETLFQLYRVVVAAARAVGIEADRLPDFLALEHGESFVLLGQDELDESALEVALREAFEQFTGAQADRPTERQVIAQARVGQHQFAQGVLANCGWECVFCGFSLTAEPRRTLLRASHIKPWRESEHAERRDVRNGVAACPTHDAAFDGGDLALTDALAVITSRRVRGSTNGAVRAFFDPPLLRSHVSFPTTSARPRGDYVKWHRDVVYAGASAVAN